MSARKDVQKTHEGRQKVHDCHEEELYAQYYMLAWVRSTEASSMQRPTTSRQILLVSTLYIAENYNIHPYTAPSPCQ